jgi:hypothetical protein
MNRDFADSTSWPWAAVAKRKAQVEIARKRGVRGLVFGIKSATYPADRLPAQPIFYDFFVFLKFYSLVLKCRPERTGFWTGIARRLAGEYDSSPIY